MRRGVAPCQIPPNVCRQGEDICSGHSQLVKVRIKAESDTYLRLPPHPPDVVAPMTSVARMRRLAARKGDVRAAGARGAGARRPLHIQQRRQLQQGTTFSVRAAAAAFRRHRRPALCADVEEARRDGSVPSTSLVAVQSRQGRGAPRRVSRRFAG
eukprot:scaffold7935_cov417-Prasinococcus_capsulatus_cf.AAC.6